MTELQRIVLLLTCLTTFTCAADEASFATFNTFWFFDDKPPHQKWWDKKRGALGQNYQGAIESIAEAIRAIDADVVALQEVENEGVVKDLVAKLKMKGLEYPYYWVGKGNDPTGQDVAVLSKFPRSGNLVRSYSDEREYYLTESDPGNESNTGLSKALRVDLEVHGEEVSVFVFHLKSQLGGHVSDSQRQAQASIARRITLPLIREGKKLIVMGDLNADRGSKTLLRLRGFDDIDADLSQITNHRNFKGSKWTYEYQGRTQQIDHILVSPMLRKNIKSGKVIEFHDETVSDHNAIFANFEF